MVQNSHRKLCNFNIRHSAHVPGPLPLSRVYRALAAPKSLGTRVSAWVFPVLALHFSHDSFVVGSVPGFGPSESNFLELVSEMNFRKEELFS